jgi:Fic family protein
MKSFEAGYLDRYRPSHEVLRTVRLLGEFKGREALYRVQVPQVLETLREVAVIQSTESSNRIEGVTAPPKRIAALVAEKTTPRNRSEQEIAGYRDVLNLVHGSYEGIELSPSVVLQLHRDLMKYSPSPGGLWKTTDNEITETGPDGTVVRFTPVAAFATPDAMDRLHAGFRKSWDDERVDHLILTPAYVLDFLCIHPFRDGNGRMSRLLGLLLLYKSGFTVGRYISLEKIIESSKESYYETLHKASQGWHDGTHVIEPWIEYFLGALVAAYKEFEQRVGNVSSSPGAKTDAVRHAVESMLGDFTARDIHDRCPHASIDLVRDVLGTMRKEGLVVALGKGRGAKWRRAAPSGGTP